MWGSRDPFLEFWDPLISRECLQLETSNLAHMDGSEYSRQNAKLHRHIGVMWGSRDPFLEF